MLSQGDYIIQLSLFSRNTETLDKIDTDSPPITNRSFKTSPRNYPNQKSQIAGYRKTLRKRSSNVLFFVEPEKSNKKKSEIRAARSVNSEQSSQILDMAMLPITVANRFAGGRNFFFSFSYRSFLYWAVTWAFSTTLGRKHCARKDFPTHGLDFSSEVSSFPKTESWVIKSDCCFWDGSYDKIIVITQTKMVSIVCLLMYKGLK